MQLDTIVNLVALAVYVTMAWIVYSALKENRKLAYMEFYAIIKRHHSQEITELRYAVMRELPSAAEDAKRQSKPLVEVNQEMHLKASTLANYYEGLAMFLRGGWSILPPEARTTMLEMLHNSVSRTWPLFEKYGETIHPGRPQDWAQSYKWLWVTVQGYRQERNL